MAMGGPPSVPRTASARSHAMVSATLLHVQRRGWRPPAPIRKLGRQLLGRAAGGDSPVGGWSNGLTPGAALGPPPAAEKSIVFRTAPAPNPSLDRPRLRCFVVTGLL